MLGKDVILFVIDFSKEDSQAYRQDGNQYKRINPYFGRKTLLI